MNIPNKLIKILNRLSNLENANNKLRKNIADLKRDRIGWGSGIESYEVTLGLGSNYMKKF